MSAPKTSPIPCAPLPRRYQVVGRWAGGRAVPVVVDTWRGLTVPVPEGRDALELADTLNRKAT